MGCPSGTCTGYELTANLEFDSDGDGDVDANDHGGAYWNSGAGWTPIGSGASDRYSGDFKGNGHTINNLFINRSSNNIGLFGAIHSTACIETLGVTNADVTGGSYTGILTATIGGAGEIVACYTTGSVTGNHYIGGLVGFTPTNATSASISSSYSAAYVSGASNSGWLIGRLGGGSMAHAYSTGKVVRPSGSTAGSFGSFAGSA